MKKSAQQRKPLYEHLSQHYYTAQQAQAVLGMDRNTFNNRVRKGLIKRTVLEGLGEYGMYEKEHIHDLAAAIEALLVAAQTRKYIYRKAEISDLDALNYLAYLHFGEGAITSECKAARQKYLEVNPNSTYCLFNFEKLLASIDVVPLGHPAILAFREGKRGWQFPDEMIEQFEPGHPLELIIIDMLVTPNVPPQIREIYAGSLLHHLSQTFRDWGSRGVEFQTIDACGGTDLGRKILESAGFTYCGEKQRNRHMYHLEIGESDLMLLRPYKRALAQWRSQQEVREP
ncbi:MAG: hypothetical protein JO202_17130 [Ktedonobacteraceae bacterium]|nr:hypothetical protein [Ktedonobacteraceae bacterium]